MVKLSFVVILTTVTPLYSTIIFGELTKAGFTIAGLGKSDFDSRIRYDTDSVSTLFILKMSCMMPEGACTLRDAHKNFIDIIHANKIKYYSSVARGDTGALDMYNGNIFVKDIMNQKYKDF